MASIFGHIAASTAIGKTFFPNQARLGLLLLAGFCAFAPDLDVIGFHFGIPYNSPFGHRGWTHSIAFAIVFGLLVAWIYNRWSRRSLGVTLSQAETRNTALFLVLATLSHPLLDMMTNGGLGVALFLPFSADRFFFPFRPIQVSPMSAGAFFSHWGMVVLGSEVLWIGVPAVILVVCRRLISKKA